ncbi:MAG TPA: GNAT family N-acetyltransferase, partial [Nannocystis exedens]|nr:GNAT family N-acetyltransferase [Nannocystis exedens]
PMVFSGPLQPPMIGAALASASVHLSPEITVRQEALRTRIDFCNERSEALDLPLLAVNESPLFFYRCGLPRVAFSVVERLLQCGIYVTASVYPSVPMTTAGIRLSLTTEHSLADIDRVLQALAEAIPAAMAEEVLSTEEVEQAFEGCIPQESLRGDAFKSDESSARSFLDLTYGVPTDATSTRTESPSQKEESGGEQLRVQVAHTIQEIDRPLWDELLGHRSCSSWHAMAAAEAAFTGNKRPEHNWSFLYVIVRDQSDQVVAATYFTVTLGKDDMLMRTEVSTAIELRRRDDPYFLTSLVVSMGSGLSEGSHLFLARKGPWQAALHRILEIALDEYQRTRAGLLLLRDFRDDDTELASFFNDNGFIKVPMLDSHLLEITWGNEEEFMARLSRRRRRQLRDVQAMTPSYTCRRQNEQLSGPEIAHLQQLYTNVAARKLRINTFLLPSSVIPEMLRSPAWEVVTLHLDPSAGGPADGAPVAWYGAHTSGGHYMPLVCGLDYEYVRSHGAYRQLLYQIVLRAEELSITLIHLGMDANYEKERFRTERVKTCAFVRSRDDFVGARMRELVAEVGLSR